MSRRIALLLRSLEGGGMQRNVVALARGMVRRGYEVEVLAVDAAGVARRELPPAVRVHRLALGPRATGARALSTLLPDLGAGDRLRLRFGPVPSLLRALPALVAHLRARPPAGLIALGTQANLAALAARRLCGRPRRLLVSEHNVLSAVARNSRRRFRHLYPHLVRAVYPEADAVVAVSAAVARDLEEIAALPLGRVRVIGNPVDLARIRELAAEAPAHPWAGAREPPLLLAVGRLHWQKGFDTLLDALARLRRRRRLRLVILGEGPERARLERHRQRLGLEEAVRMPGFVANPFAWMARAAAFVLPSRSEGFGHVLVEALACGCPVVATDCPGAPAEILEDGRWGRLVPVGDAAALARAIEAILDRPPERAALVARARALAAGDPTRVYLDLLFPGDPDVRDRRRDAEATA